jgi:hypothetical protein
MKTGCAPWWFEEEEFCLFCLQGYARDDEYRCRRCDVAVCPHCAIVVRRSRAIYCPQCRSEPTTRPSSAAAEGLACPPRRSRRPTR